MPKTSALEFLDKGPHVGRRTARRLGLGATQVVGYLKQSLAVGDSPGELIYVIPFHRLAGILPRAHEQRVDDLSVRILQGGATLHTKSSTYKRFLLTAETAGLPPGFRGVPWAHGPIPVIEIGAASRIPVCVTPHVEMLRRTKGGTADDLTIRQAVAKYYPECMQDYFAELTDLLISLFFAQGRGGVRGTARRMRRRLRQSVYEKLKMFSPNADVSSEGLYEVIERFRLRQASYYEFSRAATAVFEVVLAHLEAIAWGTHPAPEVLTGGYEAIAQDESPLGMDELRLCLDALSSHPPDAPAPVANHALFSADWLEDLRVCCRLIGEVTALQRTHDPAQIFVFVSHHLDLYSSLHFYRRFQAATSELELGGDGLTVWTGEGRQEHILLQILAKIWLSDIQVLFVPHALTEIRRGSERPLTPSGDWVVEELLYGTSIDKKLHCVIAEDSRETKDQIKTKLIDQVESYDWSSLNEVLSKYTARHVRESFAVGFRSHLAYRIYTKYVPRRGRLGGENARNLRDGVLRPAVEARVRDLLQDSRLEFRLEDWQVVQALYDASWEAGAEHRHYYAARRRILAHLQQLRPDVTPSDDWLRRRLHALAGSGVWFDGKLFSLVEKDTTQRPYLYKFALGKFAAHAAQRYSGLITKDDVRMMVEDTVKKPLGARP